jgi:hypothetical protein
MEISNGTLCYLKAVILKSHMANVPLSTCCVDGYYVNNFLATDDEQLACQDANDNNTFIIKMEQARHKVPVMVNHTCMDTNCKDKQNNTSLQGHGLTPKIGICGAITFLS